MTKQVLSALVANSKDGYHKRFVLQNMRTSNNNRNYHKCKDNLLRRIGGESILDLLVTQFCFRIQQDDELERFYGQINMNALVAMQKQLVLLALLESPSQNLKDLLNIQYQPLFEDGLNESHFELLRNHFSKAIDDCLLQDKQAVASLECHFDGLRPYFVKYAKTKSSAIKKEQGKKKKFWKRTKRAIAA